MRKSYSIIMVLCVLLFSLNGCDNGGGSGSTAQQALSSPARMASSGTDAMIVTDYTENKFCQIDKTTLAVTTCFQAKGQPTGVAYADYKGGRYFVGNKSVRSVDIFDAAGNFLGHVGGKTGLFEQVSDLAIDEISRVVYILDLKSARIDAYDFDGNLLNFDWSSGGLIRPAALEFYNDGNFGLLFVSDFGDPATSILPRIRIYDLADVAGTQVDEIVAIETGGLLTKQQTFSSPQGMFVYNGNLFVVDAGAGEVQVYDLSTKALVKTIGVRGTGDGELFYPLDVYVDAPTSDVFVCDNRNGRVAVFSGAGEVP